MSQARRPIRLVWLLLVLGLIVCAAFAGSVFYRNQHRLTAEKLAAAREKWRAAGIRDYDLEVTVRGATSGRYRLQVRGGEIKDARMNDEPFDELAKALPWTMPEIFNILQQDLERDARSGAAFTQVEFDPNDGHLIRYVRHQLGGGQQKLEMHVTFRALE